MRLYSLTNSYLSGIHSGIQTQHSTVRLMRKYEGTTQLNRWADHHETTVVLNGGDHTKLESLYTAMCECHNFPYLFDIFHEPGLNYAATSIAILLHEDDYIAMAKARMEKDPLALYSIYNTEVAYIMTEIMKMGLAK